MPPNRFPKTECVDCKKAIDYGNTLCSEIVRVNTISGKTEGHPSTHRLLIYFITTILHKFNLPFDTELLAGYVGEEFTIKVGSRKWTSETPEGCFKALLKELVADEPGASEG